MKHTPKQSLFIYILYYKFNQKNQNKNPNLTIHPRA